MGEVLSIVGCLASFLAFPPPTTSSEKQKYLQSSQKSPGSGVRNPQGRKKNSIQSYIINFKSYEQSFSSPTDCNTIYPDTQINIKSVTRNFTLGLHLCLFVFHFVCFAAAGISPGISPGLETW